MVSPKFSLMASSAFPPKYVIRVLGVPLTGYPFKIEERIVFLVTIFVVWHMAVRLRAKKSLSDELMNFPAFRSLTITKTDGDISLFPITEWLQNLPGPMLAVSIESWE